MIDKIGLATFVVLGALTISLVVAELVYWRRRRNWAWLNRERK